MNINDLTAALLGPAPRSNEEIVEQQVREWQQEAAKAIQKHYARMRQLVDEKSIAAVGRAGVHAQPQAALELFAHLKEGKTKLLTFLSSSVAADEARRYLASFHRAKEDGKEFHGAYPRLLVWVCIIRDLLDTPDAAVEDVMRATIERDAAGFPSPPATTEQGEGNGGERCRKNNTLGTLEETGME